jgi:HK97 family phage major capsid protein
MKMPKPTDGMVEEARKGLDWRSEFGRGGTEVGIARARDIVNRKDLSQSTVNRMKSFFARHEVDKKAEGFRPGEDGYPSNGRIAWALWGGDAGQSFANKYAEERAMEIERPYPNEHAARLEDPDQYDSFSRETDAGGEGIDFIYGIKDNVTELQSIRFDKKRYTAQQAQDWLKEHEIYLIEFEPASEERNMSEEIQTEDQVVEVVEDRLNDQTVQHRAMAMELSPIDEKRRSVQIALSSEEAVMRSFGYEVLEHSPEAIDLSFLASGRAPLLLDHDPSKQIGVIESVRLDGSARRLRATVRFGKGALAEEAWSDVVDGIRANISVGYAINKMEKDTRQKDTYVAKRWRPMEASLVSIPADVTVGVGRSADIPQEPVLTEPKVEVNIMSEFDIVAIQAEARKSAEKNAAQIIELGARHNQSELAARAIKEGRSIEEFRGELLEKVGSDRALEKQEIGMTQKEVKRFSLIRAIRAMANPNDARAQREAAFEFEVARAAAESYGRTPQGIMLPVDVLRTWKRDMNSSDDSSLFTDDFRGNDFIDVLRNASSVMQAGARMLTGLSGDVKIPKKTAASTAAWISTEGGPASESEMTVSAVSMTPKTLGAFTDITRQLMLQSSLDVEALVRDDLAQALALAIDKAGLEGTGLNGQPTGIWNTSGVNAPTAFAGDVPTFAEVVSMETAVAEDNALMGNLAYILPASMYGALKTTEKATGTAQFVVEPGNTINGYRAIVSNQATAGRLFFGNFADLLVGMWAGLDIIVDPYTSSTSGTVRVVALQTVDVAVRHAVSFAAQKKA